MISKRNLRPARAVEKLQQLSLNNSAGIDGTRPHNDVKSVYASKNLVVNTDGSVSLRKPLILRTKFRQDIKRVIPLPDDSYLVIKDYKPGLGFLILNKNLVAQEFYISWTDKYGNLCINKVPAGTTIYSTQVDVSECIPVQTNTGVVLSNCKVSHAIKDFPGDRIDTLGARYSLFDSSLYDEQSFSVRLLNVYYSTQYSAWFVKIHSAETNVYNTADGALVLEANTLLDNPFAARDNYDAAMPSVKTIRAYVYSTSTGREIVPTGSVSQEAVNSSTPLTDTLQVLDGVTGKVDYRSESAAPNLYEYVTHSATCSGSGTYLNVGNISFTASVEILNVSFDVKKTTLKHPSNSAYDEVYYGLTNGSRPTFKLTLKAVKEESATDLTRETGFKLSIPSHQFLVTLNVASHEGGREELLFGKQTAYVYQDAIELTAKSFSTGSEIVVYEASHEFPYTCISGGSSGSSADYEWMYDRSNAAEVRAYVGAPNTVATLSYVKETSSVSTDIRVVDLTESVKSTRFRATELLSFEKCDLAVLKAFISAPSERFEPLYCSWRYTLDGVNWLDALVTNDGVSVSEPSQDPITNVESSESAGDLIYKYLPLDNALGLSFEDSVKSRPDCIILTKNSDAWGASAIKFKLCALDTSKGTIRATYGEHLFYGVGNNVLFEESELGNSAKAVKMYSKSRLYSYGDVSLNNCILYSYPGEFNIPLSNAIELSTSADESVTTLVRWRDAIVSATEHALYLSEQQGDSFYTKVLNTAIGIPKSDEKCCIPILNGILFKSGNKIYQLYPNIYSDDGTVLNVTDISQSVSHYLEEWSMDSSKSSFAFSTESEYVLMMPQQSRTCCLRYDYNSRVWTTHVYNVEFQDVRTLALDDIRLWGISPDDSAICEFMFDTSFAKLPFSKEHLEHLDTLPYGDVVTRAAFPVAGSQGTLVDTTVSEIVEYMHSGTAADCISPIEFELDTGQKSDTILTTKQFVESKLVFATLNKDDAFPMQLTVHVDGDPHLVTRDISTDAPFWKDGSTSGVLNTTFGGLSSMSDSFNTLRQLVVRYSGKGKSVRHILTGKSLCNFKLYETYIRYKLLNVKQ